MTRAAAPKLGAYAALAALGLLGALALGRPEVVALGAPFALVVAGGLLAARTPRLFVRVRPSRDRLLEGDEVELELDVESEWPVPELSLHVAVPPRLALVHGPNPVAVRIGEDGRRLQLVLRADRWGASLVGDVSVRVRDALGLFVHDDRLDLRVPLRVYPRAEALRRVVRPLDTQVFSGNQVAREKGEGIEFADLRPYAPGDRIRRINWRASARRAELWVNEQHPERNADVVVFLDSFADARRDDLGTLDLSVRAATSLIAGYIGQRDRVGFVGFGGIVRWLRPGSGLAQLYHVVDALLDTEITLNYAWKGIDVIPPGTIPPQALVLALSPLLDERTLAALLDLRGRGFDVAVVDVSPIPFAAAGAGDADRLAHRIWRLQREALRARYERVGIATVEWREGDPLAAALEEVAAFRRQARRARA